MTGESKKHLFKNRFQGYLPVVIDVETGGVQANSDALLEVAAIFLTMDKTTGALKVDNEHTFHSHVEPFTGSRIEQAALDINKIIPHHPFRFAETEKTVLTKLYELTEERLQHFHCRRAVLVGHNAHFDLDFLQAAMKRCKLYNSSPFHQFTVFDTATLGAYAFGKSVLAKALHAAKIPFDKEAAHSALYDATKTAELFCKIMNAKPNF